MSLFSSHKKKDPLVHFLKNKIGIKTTSLNLYQQAFTHKSISQSNNNERLEFLGDQVFSSVIAEYLFNKYPKKTEGELTKLKSKIVSRKHLNKVGEQLGLQDHILYIDYENGHKNILGNTLEALIGAIVLDKSYKTAKKIIIKLLLEKLVSVEEIDQKDEDYKSQLVIWGQKKQKQIVFDTIPLMEKDMFQTSILIDGKEFQQATAYTKKQAEQSASKFVIEKLKTSF